MRKTLGFSLLAISLLIASIGSVYLWFSQPAPPAPLKAANSAVSSARTKQPPAPACLQPPANLDWGHLTAKDLARYGLPPMPLSASALPQLLALFKQFKHRSCSIALPTTHKIHAQSAVQNPTWAGAIVDQMQYRQVQTTWNLPCIKSQQRDTSSSAWIGLGGVQSGSPLVQAGVDNDIDVQGHISYEAWAETYLPATASHAFQDHQVLLNFTGGFHCNDQLYLAVLSDLAGGFDRTNPNTYFVGNVTTGEYQNYNPDWPASDGVSAEWIVEQPTFLVDQQVSFKPLTNFGTISFNFCLASPSDNSLRLASTLPLHLSSIRSDSTTLASAAQRLPGGIDVTWLKGS